jgi:hypothetical protein
VTFLLADRCPRLAKARDDHERHVRDDRQAARQRSDALLSAERNLAHRELQLVRAMHTGKGRYIAERQRKLKAARRKVAILRGTA